MYIYLYMYIYFICTYVYIYTYIYIYIHIYIYIYIYICIHIFIYIYMYIYIHIQVPGSLFDACEEVGGDDGGTGGDMEMNSGLGASINAAGGAHGVPEAGRVFGSQHPVRRLDARPGVFESGVGGWVARESQRRGEGERVLEGLPRVSL